MGIALAALSLSSSCLLTRPIVADDAEVTVLMPPAIVQDPTLTFPPPGSIVIVRGNTARVRLTVAQEGGRPLQVRAWLNRQRPFNMFVPGTPVIVNPDTIPPGDAGAVRPAFDLPVVLPNAPSAGCFKLDVYISAEFRRERDREHEPLREHDVAHARWYFVREAEPGDPTVVTARSCGGDFETPAGGANP